MGPPLLRLVLPLLQSKKNDVQVRKAKRKRATKRGAAGSVYHYAGTSQKVKRQEHAIRRAAREALKRAGARPILVADVALDVTWCVPSRKLVVDVRQAPGSPHACRSHDLVNMLDGMELESGVDLAALVDAARWLEGVLGHELPGQVVRAGARTKRVDANSSTK